MHRKKLRSIGLIQLWATIALSPGQKGLGHRKARLDEASKGNQEQDQREILGRPREQAAMG